MTNAFGIDIGGSGIKGAPVDLDRGELAEDRYRIPTPQPSIPESVAAVVAEIVGHFGWEGPLGITVPAVVQKGFVRTAANIDPSWIGTDADALFERTTPCDVYTLNDADAAGLAEVRYGVGEGEGGVVVLLTFGTGIGSAVFVDGVLVPNTELGHVEFKGGPAEHYAAARLVERNEMHLAPWADRVNEYLQYLERVLSPDLFIVGGGISKRFDEFKSHFDTVSPVVPAELRNNAGIVGAALAASERLGDESKANAKGKKKGKKK